MKPEDIDFTKWMIERADGFQIVNVYRNTRGDIEFSFIRGEYKFQFQIDKAEESLIYPLLLTRAIEGVNKINPDQEQIAQNAHSVQVLGDYGRRVDENYQIRDNIDTAKKSALRYIWEQERKS